MPRRASLAVFLGFAGAMLLMVGISAGTAQEDKQSKRAEVKSAQERLMQARMDQSAAFESYNAALRELNQLDEEIAGTEGELQAAESEFVRAQQNLEERASQVYKSGNVAFMDVLVGVDDFSDFATRLDLWMKLLEEERDEFEDVRQARDELKVQKDLLEDKRAQRTEAIEAAINRKEEAENAEAEAQAYLDSLSGELRSLIQAEQERRAAEARANAEKLREKFAVQAAEAREPAPVQVSRPEELPEQQLSLQAQQPVPEPQKAQEAAPKPQPEPKQDQESAPAPQLEPQTRKAEPAPEPVLQSEPQRAQEAAPDSAPDPELLAQQEEAERLAAERRAAAEQARAAQAEAERQAKLAAEQAEAQQKAAERREARERAAAAEEARLQAEQAAIEQAAAELAAQQAAERRAQRIAELEAERQAELAAQQQADLEAQQQADLQAQREAEQAAAEEQYEAETMLPAESAPADPALTDPMLSPDGEQSPPTGSGPPASASGNAVVSEGAKYLGTPYVLGGWESCLPYEMMDCSCFTATVYEAFGFSLPDSPGGQMGYGTPVSGPPAAGDLVFWSEDGSGYITHVGIAMGDGTTIHASAFTGFAVSGTPIDAIPGYMGARRLL